MRPVLRTVIDKNGGSETVFTPTAQMIAYSIVRARNMEDTEERVCDLAGISTAAVRQWKSKYGSYFNNWLEEAIEFDLMDEAAVLERVGMMQALQPGNFQYFREMARAKGVIKDEVKTQNITINTDFKAILVAAGGDLGEARKRLMESARGLVVTGGSRVASAPQQRLEGSGDGEGDRTRDEQSGSLEMANSLGGDRGRAKRAKPVPTIPE